MDNDDLPIAEPAENEDGGPARLRLDSRAWESSYLRYISNSLPST